MKPGDLFRVSDHDGYYSRQSPIGVLIEIKDEEHLANPYVVLVEGKLRCFNPFELVPMQTPACCGTIKKERS